MEIRVIREEFTDKATVGELSVNGIMECYTLEDKDRGLTSDMFLENIKQIKVYGQTAIPRGRYAVKKLWWEKVHRWVPHITNVPGFDGILIHSGNTADDSLGCILVGETRFTDRIGNTKEARENLDAKIIPAIDRGEDVWITIDNFRNDIAV